LEGVREISFFISALQLQERSIGGIASLKFSTQYANEVLPEPSKLTWEKSAAGFAQMGYPRGVAAMDGKHFRCVVRLSDWSLFLNITGMSPFRSGSSYFNFKGFFSVVLLAVVDSSGKFLMIDCGCKGKFSDSSRVLIQSWLNYIKSAIPN
uniref:DDE Tnp4 domain-containing protein n=1 Tax=Nippostrongylus brasiliensis TaxID=27835 RepID=A0A0N4YG73_NIPBR